MAQALRANAGTQSKGGTCYRMRKSGPVARQPVACRGLVEDLLKPLTSMGQNPVLNEGIRTFYDESSGLWENMWGEHMHHGYYEVGSKVQKSRKQAQIDMIENVLSFAGVTDVTRMVDVGCGIGGSSRYICKKFNAKSEGITLSPVQAQRANELSGQVGLAENCNFQVGDALAQPFADDTFDLAWSLESGEHMPDKKKFVNEMIRVTQPGGKVIIITWCHRNLLPGQVALQPDEQAILDRINEAFYLPEWCSLDDYKKIFEAQGMENIKTDDWSENVAPFWGEVIKSALTPEGVQGLFGAGWETIKGAIVMPLMARGFEVGVVKFVCITGTVPQSAPKAVAATSTPAQA